MPEPTGLIGLRHADLYHTGFVVDDLAAAKEKVGGGLGITWLEGCGTVRIITAGGSVLVKTSYALSAEGPHHLELVQAVAGTLYRADGTARAHHVGYWVDDVAAVSTTLAERGLPTAATIGFDGGRRGPICAYHQAGESFYVEIVARWMKSILFPK